MSSYRYAKGAAAENALLRRLRMNSGTMAFRTPGSRGAADVVWLQPIPYPEADGSQSAFVMLIQVKAGRKPSEPEQERLEARMRAESPFPCEVRVVWAKPCRWTHLAGGELDGRDCDGWEFVWL